MIHTRIAIKTWEDSKPHERLLWLLDISWCTLDELLQLVNHLSDPSEVSTCRVPGSARQCPVPGSARLLHIIGQLFWRGHLRPCRAVPGTTWLLRAVSCRCALPFQLPICHGPWKFMLLKLLYRSIVSHSMFVGSDRSCP